MWLGEIGRRAALWLRRDRATAELEEEMRLHRELRAESLQSLDRTDVEARTLARRRFGNPLAIQEQSRDQWGFAMLDNLRQDVRYATRRLRQRPGYTISVVLVLALGIGATTAMFSAVDAAILRPLPFARPSELVSAPRVVVPFDPGQNRQQRVFANHQADINDLASMTTTFSHVAAWASGGLNLSDPDRPVRLTAGVVTADFFNTLGVAPEFGRGFSVDEGKPGNTHVVVLSNEFWQRQFGSKPMLEQTIQLNNKSYLVIGVMPRGFSFPKQSDLWIPMSVPVTPETFEPFRGWLGTEVIARVAPGVSLTVARARLLARWQLGIARDSASASQTNLPEVVRGLQKTGTVIPLQQSLIGDKRTALFVLLGATALLLLIACANVTNLLLSQAISRRRELAVREVLGATRIRVVRQLLTECALLSVAGALLGVAIAPLSLGLLRTLMPAGLAGVAPIQVDLRVLLFATLLGLLTGLTFGLWPALRTTGSSLGETIKSGGGHGSSAAGTTRARRVLVAAEIALTLVLLIGAGLMLRSFNRLMQLDREFKSAQVGTLEMSFPAATNANTARLQFAARLLERTTTTPGIAAAGLVNSLPLGGGGGILLSIAVDGMAEIKDDDRPGPLQLYASGGYFDAIGIPLIAGRTFTPADDAVAPSVAVINEEMARLYWPGANALGRTFHLGSEMLTVIGIVRNIRESRLDEEPLPQMYLSIYRSVPSTIALIARGTMSPRGVLAAMQGAVRAVDPSQAVFHVRTMDEVLNTSAAPRRTNTLLISLFGALALILSSLGVYAVVAHGVAQRSREFGIRTALGATGGNLISLIGREMIATTIGGILTGLVAAWLLVHLAETMLFGVTSHDPATFVIVPCLLILPAALATILPARRALRVDPAQVMRAD